MQVKLALPRLRLAQKALDLIILNRRLEGVDLLDLLGNDIQGMHLIVLRKQDSERKAHVAGTGNGNFHAKLLLLKS